MKTRIKEVRKEKGITQQQLADRLHVSRQAISKLENGDNVTVDTIKKVAEALDCPVMLLLIDKNDAVEATLYLVSDEDLSFDSDPSLKERFEKKIDQYYKYLETTDTAYIKKLSIPALKLNDLGRKLLLDNAEALAANEELTKGQGNGEQAQEEK